MHWPIFPGTNRGLPCSVPSCLPGEVSAALPSNRYSSTRPSRDCSAPFACRPGRPARIKSAVSAASGTWPEAKRLARRPLVFPGVFRRGIMSYGALSPRHFGVFLYSTTAEPGQASTRIDSLPSSLPGMRTGGVRS